MCHFPARLPDFRALRCYFPPPRVRSHRRGAPAAVIRRRRECQADNILQSFSRHFRLNPSRQPMPFCERRAIIHSMAIFPTRLTKTLLGLAYRRSIPRHTAKEHIMNDSDEQAFSHWDHGAFQGAVGNSPAKFRRGANAIRRKREFAWLPPSFPLRFSTVSQAPPGAIRDPAGAGESPWGK